MNFVLVERPQFEVMQTFKITHGHFYDRSLTLQVIGYYEGNINDPEFLAKLERVRGRLKLRNVNYNELPGYYTVKEVKRMNDLERYNRKMSKVFAEFWRRVDQCNGLFREQEIKLLADKYKNTVAEMKKRYNVLE